MFTCTADEGERVVCLLASSDRGLASVPSLN